MCCYITLVTSHVLPFRPTVVQPMVSEYHIVSNDLTVLHIVVQLELIIIMVRFGLIDYYLLAIS